MAGVAATVASSVFALVCGIGAIVAVFAAGFFTRRRRWIGALAGGLAAQALLRGYSYGFTGLPTIVAIAAVAPLLISAYRNASGSTKRIARRGAVIAGVVVIVLTVFTAVSALRARDRISEAIRFSDMAIDAAQGGDGDLAAGFINASAEELDAVATDYNRPWLYPARYVPVLGQHAAVLGDVADVASSVAVDAGDVLVALEPDALVQPGGRVDLDAVDELVAPMHNLRTSLVDAVEIVDDLDSTWLIKPARERVDELDEELATVLGDVEVADDLMGIASGLLGGEGERRYLVMFTTPSESRGLGGFAGNWAELVVTDGKLELAETGRGNDISTALPPFGITIPESVATLYDGFDLETKFQNLPAVPDFPTVATLARLQFEAAYGRTVDGVINVDHAGMAGIVTLTGPIFVDAQQMNARQIEEFVLRGQYEQYEDNERRLEVLEELTQTAFDRLVNIDLPSPAKMLDVFGPLVDGNHVRVQSFDDVESVALESVGLSGSFPSPIGQDLLAVVTQNIGENKIDIFLEREISYETVIDPGTGALRSVLRIALHNTAPAEGLPQSIIGNNDLGMPFGTNRLRVQFYTPLEVDGATLDGAEIQLIGATEFGWNRLHRDLWLDPGQTEVLEIQLSGSVETTDGYALEVAFQPLVNADSVELTATSANGEDFSEVFGFDAQGRATVTPESDILVGLSFDS